MAALTQLVATMLQMMEKQAQQVDRLLNALTAMHTQQKEAPWSGHSNHSAPHQHQHTISPTASTASLSSTPSPVNSPTQSPSASSTSGSTTGPSGSTGGSTTTQQVATQAAEETARQMQIDHHISTQPQGTGPHNRYHAGRYDHATIGLVSNCNHNPTFHLAPQALVPPQPHTSSPASSPVTTTQPPPYSGQPAQPHTQ